MPLDKGIKRVLVIGSGPIVIGQAAEFDYAGTQACRVLREEGIEIILVNSNPATIMTDHHMADKIYLEPLTLETIKRIITKERPDSILSGLGGQTGLTLCMQLAREGFLDEMCVRLLGSSPETIDKAEDRLLFKETMESINQPVVPSVIAENLDTALAFADQVGYPLIVRPAFTLGGSGGGIAHDRNELIEIAEGGLALSPITQILVEQSISGWKEIEFEVMRDKAGNTLTVCSMENLDPVGIHTGDSIVVAPALTLADREYQMLRSAALQIVDSLEVEGGCNCQFALHPSSFEYAVIEVNPRVSRSSALASKATGYAIAKVATKIAVGYTLDEIRNDVTGTTFAAFEPALDYVAVKFPKWPFDKFVYAKRELGTQMKATGEVMSIADTFEDALIKAVRGAEIGLTNLKLPRLVALSDSELSELLNTVTDERLFVLYEAIRRGVSLDKIHEITMVDHWFLHAISNIVERDEKSALALESSPLSQEVENHTQPKQKNPIYKMVDTCGAEFAAQTPYFYAINEGIENEALPFIERSKKPRVVVLGSGPIRIGQGIEFDYASVQCVWTLKKMGYETVVINCNPETVSTDFDTGDRLYFEPLCLEEVMSVIEIEKPLGVVVAFGGGTAIKLTRGLHEHGVNIIGTSADSIDLCEDRERFDDLLEKLDIARPKGLGVMTKEEALKAADSLGYPVLLRPSYVLGGQNMIIAHEPSDITEYMEIILRNAQESPILIDKYLSGIEIEVDALCDGDDVLIPGIMEHIERSGVHSGDSIAVYPPLHVDDELADRIYTITRKICDALHVRGLVNIQYVLFEGEIFIIEVNPRASRTVPYISKVTGIPLCELATRASLGEKLSDLGYTSGVAVPPPYVAVKVPVFSFEKLIGVDTHLGPEMKSTGEVLGIGTNLKEALYKGLLAAGYSLRKEGGVLITVRDSDKPDITDIANKLVKCGFDLYATAGTASYLSDHGFTVQTVSKIYEDAESNTETLLESGRISYVISTSKKGRSSAHDGVKIRRKATALGIPCLTSPDTAHAIADSLLSGYSEINTELVDINALRKEPLHLSFTKMQGCGNDYLYFNCIDGSKGGGQEILSPESLPIRLADRHFGVGSDGVVLILKSDIADARMRMFNADGSEGLMCGNALRCIGKYLFDTGIVSNKEISIETSSGIKQLSLRTTAGLVSSVQVDMGEVELAPEKIPVRLGGERVINEPITVAGKEFFITCLSVGNPHCVVFCTDVDSLNLSEIGPLFEHNEIFPDRVNTEFVEIISKSRLKMRVWERGNGETLACGTGACAAGVAAVLNGYCDEDADMSILLAGGELNVRYEGGRVYKTGECKTIFEGAVHI